MENENNQEYGKILFNWQIPEYEAYNRTKTWYTTAITISILLMLFSFFTVNFLFAVIIIITSLVVILKDTQNPDIINITITEEGLIIEKKFYDYDEFKNFFILYKPRQELKSLYFEFHNPLRHRLSIPIKNENPLPIRENLLKYLSEDLEKTEQPLSEQIAKILKL